MGKVGKIVTWASVAIAGAISAIASEVIGQTLQGNFKKSDSKKIEEKADEKEANI